MPPKQSAHQRLAVMKWFSGIEDARRMDVMVLLCQVLYERGSEPLPPISTFIPSFSEKKGVPHEVLVTVDEVMACFGGRIQRTPGSAHDGGTTIIVETQEAKEAKEKFVRLAGRRFVRFPHDPWNAFYLHPWLAKLEAGLTVPAVSEVWLRTIKEAFTAINFNDIFLPRQKHLYSCVTTWFQILPVPCPAADKLPEPYVMHFCHLAEQLLELMVLGTKLEGTLSSATATLELELQAQYHSGQMDYFSAYKAVLSKEKVKDSKNEFSGQRGGRRGRGGGK